MNKARTRYPTTTTKHLVIAKPRFRILFVRTGDESQIRFEVAGRPFPHIPDHLPASECTVTCGQRVDRDTSQSAPIKICAFQLRIVVAPGIPAFAFCNAVTVCCWLAAR